MSTFPVFADHFLNSSSLDMIDMILLRVMKEVMGMTKTGLGDMTKM